MRHRSRLASGLVAVLTLLAAGCATVLDGATQTIRVEATSGGDSLSGVLCTLKNDQGESRVLTPGWARVRYDRSDLRVACTSGAFAGPDSAAGAEVKPKVLGNLLIGGLVGFGVDHFGGAGWQYPSTLTVEMSPRPDAPQQPDPVADRQRREAARVQAAAARDEARSFDLVRRTACEPAGPLLRQQLEPGVNRFAVACSDGRTAHTVCQMAECRFKALGD